MATLTETFTNIANAIRTKGSTTAKITPANMPQAITDLPSGDFNFVREWAKANNNSLNNLFNGFKGKSVDNFIKFNDTTGVIDMQRMFYGCAILTTIPLLDTSSVNNVANIFTNCVNLATIPKLDTSKVTDMNNMFHYCNKLTTIPLLDTSSVTNMQNMFSSCSSLITIPAIDTSSVTNMQEMFSYCNKLTTIPLLDTSSVTNMQEMFNECSNLTTIPKLNCEKVTSFGNGWYYSFVKNCPNIEEINMININADLDISACKKMQQPALHTLISNLKVQNGTTRKLTLGSTLLARVSEEDKTLAKNRGWTLA